MKSFFLWMESISLKTCKKNFYMYNNLQRKSAAQGRGCLMQYPYSLTNRRLYDVQMIYGILTLLLGI